MWDAQTCYAQIDVQLYYRNVGFSDWPSWYARTVNEDKWISERQAEWLTDRERQLRKAHSTSQQIYTRCTIILHANSYAGLNIYYPIDYLATCHSRLKITAGKWKRGQEKLPNDLKKSRLTTTHFFHCDQQISLFFSVYSSFSISLRNRSIRYFKFTLIELPLAVFSYDFYGKKVQDLLNINRNKNDEKLGFFSRTENSKPFFEPPWNETFYL